MISIPGVKYASSLRKVEEEGISSSLSQLRKVLGDGRLFGGQTLEWVGRAYSGKSGLLKFWVEELLAQGIAVSWIDTYSTLEAESFSNMSFEHFWILRPPVQKDAARFAEWLIRSECFGVVILEMKPRVSDRIIRRLQHLAKQHHVILVWIHQCADDALGGVVAHRIRTETRIMQRDTDLSQWCSAGVELLLRNVKQAQYGDQSVTLHLHALTHTPECNRVEYADRGGRHDQRIMDFGKLL